MATTKNSSIKRMNLLRLIHRMRRDKTNNVKRSNYLIGSRISTSIWDKPQVHSFSRPLSGINREYNEPEERSEKKKMNWAQAKRSFPKLRPFADADKDGIYNMFDCRPFNKKKQGKEHEDQLGWHGGKGEKKASNNITGITQKWKKQEGYKEEFDAQDLLDDEDIGTKNMKARRYNAEVLRSERRIIDKEDDEHERKVSKFNDELMEFDENKASDNISNITKTFKNKSFPKRR